MVDSSPQEGLIIESNFKLMDNLMVVYQPLIAGFGLQVVH